MNEVRAWIGGMLKSIPGTACALVLGMTGAPAADLQPLNIAYPEANSQYLSLDVAIEKKFFEAEGFEARNTTVNSTQQSIQFLVSRQLHLTSPQPDALFLAYAKGATDLAIIGQPALKPDWLFVVRPEISDWPDLKGKILGTSGLRGTEFWLTERVLADHGLTAKDLTPIQVGLSALKLAALTKGAVQAAVLYQPTAEDAVILGMKSLFDFSALQNYPPAYFVVSRTWAVENQNGIRLGRALRRAHQWLADPAHRAEAIDILRKYTKRSPDILAKVYDQYFGAAKLYSPDASVDSEGLKRVLSLLVQKGELAEGAISTQMLLLPKQHGGLQAD